VRHLATRYDPLIARAWQDLPLIQMPPKALETRPLRDDPDAQMRGFTERPFEDFVLDLDARGYTIFDVERAGLGHYWFRVSGIWRFQETYPRDRPWWQGLRITTKEVRQQMGLDPGRPEHPNPADHDSGPAPQVAGARRIGVVDSRRPLGVPTDYRRGEAVVIECWALHPDVGHFLPVPETTVIEPTSGRSLVLQTPLERATYARCTPEEQKMMVNEQKRHVLFCKVLLYHLALRTDYLVEERPAQQPRKPRPDKDKKPWCYMYLPRVILLPPQHLAAPRTPSSAPQGSPPEEGSHMGKRPHQRRSHWRTLRSERYGQNRGRRIRVREAWIGPREFCMNGNVYRVID
jgi:hypothetical protein